MYKRILVPVDGNELSDRAMKAGVDLAQQLGATVVGFVAEPLPPLPASPRSESLMREEFRRHEARVAAHAQSVLSRFKTTAEEAGVPFEGIHEEVPLVHQGILAAAQAQRCDMIVMVTHGRGAFGEFLFGSETKAVLAQSKLPLLVLH